MTRAIALPNENRHFAGFLADGEPAVSESGIRERGISTFLENEKVSSESGRKLV
jgi:hypothetical protein